MQQEYLQIGEIVRPQGIRGEVKLRAMTEDMSRYARLESVFLKKGGRLEEKKVLKGRSYDGFAFLQLEGRKRPRRGQKRCAGRRSTSIANTPLSWVRMKTLSVS